MLLTGRLMEDDMKHFIVLFLAVLSVSCVDMNLKDNNNLFIAKNTGWMHGNCLAIKNQDIKIPTDITLVKLEEKNTSEKAKIISQTKSQEECLPLMEDRKK